MARTGSPVDRSVLHALGLSGILMERLFFLFLLLFIHLGVFAALPNSGVAIQERELRLLSRIRNNSANRKIRSVIRWLQLFAEQRRRGHRHGKQKNKKTGKLAAEKEELEIG